MNPKKHTWPSLRSDLGASTSEYAAIFALLVITIVVSINVVGDHVRDAAKRMDSRLIHHSGLAVAPDAPRLQEVTSVADTTRPAAAGGGSLRITANAANGPEVRREQNQSY